MHNVYRGGTPDVWYSGKKALWIEYKWIARVPKKGRVKPKLSKLQLLWLRGRSSEGRSVYVVVGYPGGAVLVDPSDWEKGLMPNQFRQQTITRQALADWIAA